MILKKLLGSVFASVISRNQYCIYMSEQVLERIERGMEEIQQAQDRFARAMTQYAEQLKGHTESIEGLSKASHELTKSAAEQNRVLIRLFKLVEQPAAGMEQIIPEPEEEAKAENILFPPGCYRTWQLQNKDDLGSGGHKGKITPRYYP